MMLVNKLLRFKIINLQCLFFEQLTSICDHIPLPFTICRHLEDHSRVALLAYTKYHESGPLIHQDQLEEEERYSSWLQLFIDY